MLTEKECDEALDSIYKVADKLVLNHNIFIGSYDILKKLIQVHFSNPPLKFDELKEGMWVGDNKMVLYIRIAKIIGKTIYAEDFLYGFDCYGRYEKNRFYRKQVEE